MIKQPSFMIVFEKKLCPNIKDLMCYALMGPWETKVPTENWKMYFACSIFIAKVVKLKKLWNKVFLNWIKLQNTQILSSLRFCTAYAIGSKPVFSCFKVHSWVSPLWWLPHHGPSQTYSRLCLWVWRRWNQYTNHQWRRGGS